MAIEHRIAAAVGMFRAETPAVPPWCKMVHRFSVNEEGKDRRERICSGSKTESIAD
jgi:hypothetical protein